MPQFICIPENYYAIVDEQSQAILPDIITCMGISITTCANKKIVAHCADSPGFPLKETSHYKHPLPLELHAFEQSSLIFKFLLNELKVGTNQIKSVTIFGNYLRRDIFPNDILHNFSEFKFKQYIAEQMHISLEKIALFPLKYSDVLIDLKGCLTILPDAESQFDKIVIANYEYYKKMQDVSLDKNRIISNFNFFKMANPRRYFKDDEFIEYGRKPKA